MSLFLYTLPFALSLPFILFSTFSLKLDGYKKVYPSLSGQMQVVN